MLLDLPAGEVEDWVIQQEHAAAIVVQSNFRRHKAKKEVAAARGFQSRALPPVSPASISPTRTMSSRPSTTRAPRWISTSPRRRGRLGRRAHGGVAEDGALADAMLGLPETTMDTYIEGRQRTDRLLREYRERESKTREAAAARRATCAQAERRIERSAVRRTVRWRSFRRTRTPRAVPGPARN